MDYTHVALIASVRRLAALPTATSTGSADSDILVHANEVLQSEVVPFIMDLREDYFLQVKTQDVTAGRSAYRLPVRAVGGKLREAAMVESGGNVRNLVRLSLDDLEDWPAESGVPRGFYFRGNSIVLVPAPAGTGEQLQLTYYIRPSQVVSTGYGTVTIVNTGTGVVTWSATGTFTPTSNSQLVDHLAKSSVFECYDIDKTPTSNTTSTFTTLPVDLAVGDFVCVAEQSPVPQIPAEFHPLLYVKTALRFAESLGNQGRIAYLAPKSGAMEEKLTSAFAPRIDGEPKIITPGPYGLLGGWDGW